MVGNLSDYRPPLLVDYLVLVIWHRASGLAWLTEYDCVAAGDNPSGVTVAESKKINNKKIKNMVWA